MIVDIGLVPLHFYQYGSDDSDQVGAQQDSTRRNVTETLTYTTSRVTQSLEAITMNMNQCVASMSSKTAEDNITSNNTQSFTATASNVPQSLAATANNLAVDDDDRKPAAVLFEAISTACNVTQLLEVTAGNKTQSPVDMASNATQSLAATTSNVTVDDDDRKPGSQQLFYLKQLATRPSHPQTRQTMSPSHLQQQPAMSLLTMMTGSQQLFYLKQLQATRPSHPQPWPAM
jgi:hypothetical protein